MLGTPDQWETLLINGRDRCNHCLELPISDRDSLSVAGIVYQW